MTRKSIISRRYFISPSGCGPISLSKVYEDKISIKSPHPNATGFVKRLYEMRGMPEATANWAWVLGYQAYDAFATQLYEVCDVLRLRCCDGGFDIR